MQSAEASAKSGPTLSEAMERVFRPKQDDEEFARALANLAVPVTTASAAHVLRGDDQSPLGSSPAKTELPSHLADWVATLSREATQAPEPIENEGAIAIAVALPSGNLGTLVVRLRNQATSLRALAFERLVALSRLSFTAYRHEDLIALEHLVALIYADAELEELASRIRSFVDADTVAIAWFEGDRAKLLAISDQPQATRRAALPEMLEAELGDARNPANRPKNVFAAAQANGAFLLKADNARRHQNLLPMLVQSAAAAHSTGEIISYHSSRRWIRRAAFFLAAVCLALIPIPDARRVPSEVISTNARMITAPLSGVVLGVDVADGDVVQAGQSSLFQLDTDDIQQELTSAQADYSRALLDRESARGARDAAALRNTELEAEGLRARIDLLEGRRIRASVKAPINGVVSGDRLNRFVGATVRQGDPILEVLDPSSLALKLEVPDALLNRIQDGEMGIFRPDFAPNQAIEGAVEWISPAQSERSDVAVFQGRVAITDAGEALRPGLRGVFAFERKFKPVYRVVWDAVRDWVLLRLWL